MGKSGSSDSREYWRTWCSVGDRMRTFQDDAMNGTTRRVEGFGKKGEEDDESGSSTVCGDEWEDLSDDDDKSLLGLEFVSPQHNP